MSRPGRSRCLLLFARHPREEGRVKRLPLAEPLFEYARRRIARAAAAVPGVDLLVPSQRGATFGARLANAFRDARALGYRSVVAVPIDAPGLGARQIGAAFEALEARDVVLGRSPDGGVYLFGARVEVEPLFAGVRWLTPRVASDLAANAPGAAVLPDRIADVDSAAGLLALRADETLEPEARRLVRGLLSPARPERPAGGRRPRAVPARLVPGPRAPPAVPPS